jgi:hypothetical protein
MASYLIFRTVVSKDIPVTGRGGLYSYEVLRTPHCLDSRLADGGKVISPMYLLHFTPQKHYFSASGTHFCQRLSEPQGLVWPEGSGKLKKFDSCLLELTKPEWNIFKYSRVKNLVSSVTILLSISYYGVWYADWCTEYVEQHQIFPKWVMFVAQASVGFGFWESQEYAELCGVSEKFCSVTTENFLNTYFMLNGIN